MSKKNPVGFIWNQHDPNCITLRSTTSNRLGQLLGTYDNEKFSSSLESHLDMLNSKEKALEKQIKNYKQQNELANNRIEVLEQQRLYIGCCLLSSIGLLMFFLCR